MMRRLALILALLALGGCFDRTAVLRDPVSGEARTCRSSLQGLNPWTQSDACVAAAVAQGWVPLP